MYENDETISEGIRRNIQMYREEDQGESRFTWQRVVTAEEGVAVLATNIDMTPVVGQMVDPPAPRVTFTPTLPPTILLC